MKSVKPHGALSKKLLASVKKILNQKVTFLKDFRAGKEEAQRLQETIASSEELAELDPLHALYVYGQNQMSVFVDQISSLPDVKKLTNLYVKAEDEYLPSGPPMSPLTYSYFNCWGTFDLCVGIKKETFGTMVVDLCKSMGSDPLLISIFEAMQASRMGLYIQEGTLGKFVLLREFITGKKIKCLSPAGYKGRRGELWYVRVFDTPQGMDSFGYSVAFTTPYLISERQNGKLNIPSEEKWLAFFERTFPETNKDDPVEAYEHLMKYGVEKNYWNEYVFEAYQNHTAEMVLLVGYPDIDTSRPHSRVNGG